MFRWCKCWEWAWTLGRALLFMRLKFDGIGNELSGDYLVDLMSFLMKIGRLDVFANDW